MSDDRGIPELISFSYDSFMKLLDSLVNNFSSAGESMIFQMGRDFGVGYCQKVLMENPPGELELRDMFDYVIKTASKDGWANMEIDEFNPQNGSIHVIMKQNVFEPVCTMLHGSQCFFLRGFLSGIIKELTNMDYMFFSSQCTAHNDEHCSIKLVAQVN